MEGEKIKNKEQKSLIETNETFDFSFGCFALLCKRNLRWKQRNAIKSRRRSLLIASIAMIFMSLVACYREVTRARFLRNWRL